LLSFGDKDEGQLFTNTLVVEDKTIEVGSIVEVSCGNNHTFLRTSSAVFCCGNNFFGQLGLGKEVKEVQLQQHPFFKEQVFPSKIFCRYHQSFIITRSGAVFCCGFNEESNLGVRLSERKGNVFSFTSVQGVSAFNIVKIAIGSRHCLMLSDSKVVFVSGLQENGQLFLPTTSKRTTKITKHEVMSSFEIDDIACGQYYSVAVSTSRCKLFIGGMVNGGKKPIFEEYNIAELFGVDSELISNSLCFEAYCSNNYCLLRAYCSLNLFSEGDIILRWDGTTFLNISSDFSKILQEPIQRITPGPDCTAIITSSGKLFMLGENAVVSGTDYQPKLMLLSVSCPARLESFAKKGAIVVIDNFVCK